MSDTELRTAAMRWVAEQYAQHGGAVPRDVLVTGFSIAGRRITLAGPSGIWRPAGFDLPLSITAVHDGPYPDAIRSDGLVAYQYRRSGPEHRDNVGLREAMRTRTPLVYFHGIMKNRYVPVWPVFIMDDIPAESAFLVAVDPAYALGDTVESRNVIDALSASSDSILGIRRYVAAAVRRRLHQVAFREQVVAAYSTTCALCRLRHAELLDAAHIIPDSRPNGDPGVPNGLCLCKIHHSAYDQNLIGISPDYQIHVRRDVLEESDGPMLQHGLKGLHQGRIILPGRITDRPDRERLEERFGEFLRAV